MNQGYIKMHQKDGLMKTGGSSSFLEGAESKSKQAALTVLESAGDFRNNTFKLNESFLKTSKPMGYAK